MLNKDRVFQRRARSQGTRLALKKSVFLSTRDGHKRGDRQMSSIIDAAQHAAMSVVCSMILNLGAGVSENRGGSEPSQEIQYG